MSIHQNKKIFIAGHRGMVGSACLLLLEKEGFNKIITKNRSELDLSRQADVEHFFNTERPEVVIFAAAKVGGIQANIASPSDFLYDNLIVQSNVFNSCINTQVELVVNIGSSCIYPRNCPQPMKEEYLLDGKPEPTNEGYALAKIAGLKQLAYAKEQYGLNALNLMPCNLYGPNDSFDLAHSHVLSALVKRFSDAKANNSETITLWGTGAAKREFMHVNDLAKAILFFMNSPFDEEHFPIGWGEDVSIKELSILIAKETGFQGSINWDTSKPDGMPRKCMDISLMKEKGFHPEIDLTTGIQEMISNYNNL
jgi:GDP-L-fucose synthase